MRIGIDARLNAYRQGGIAQYTLRLLEALAAQARPDEHFIALQHRKQTENLVMAPAVRSARLFTPPHHRLEQWALPVELLPQRLDLLHSPDFVAPTRRLCPAVVTIHDLAFIRFPEILDADAKRYYSQVGASARAADAIIAVSQATRQDIVELLNIPQERVEVVYEAAAPHFRRITVGEDEQRQIGGATLRANSFALFVSTLEPRKNLETLLRALRICIDEDPQAGYHLVIAGSRGWLDGPIFASIEELRLADHLSLIGWPAQDELVWLYNACRLYANPSLYEGFGLPVLEALACGAPTLIADTSSLPEVAGEAAWKIPPRDLAGWAEALRRLWGDPAAQAELRKRGPAQAHGFSWERAAQETRVIYQKAMR